MAEAALKYDEFEDFDNIEPIQVPAGGIATFLTAKEGMFADDDELPDGGIASVKQVADQLAEYGRHEDDFMVHAAEGETVIPMEVFRKNPILKENIYKQMRDMGLEPERYVVGNDFNSINPVTGQPEFFLKKMFKKLGKFLKKAVSVILPIVGAIFLGPLGASLGSGIATLIQGGNLKDAFKAAAISGLTAGVMNAVGGGIQAARAGGNFLTGAKEGALGSGGFTRTFSEAMAAGKSAGAAGALAAESATIPGYSLEGGLPSSGAAAPVATAPVATAPVSTAADLPGYSLEGGLPSSGSRVPSISENFKADTAIYKAGGTPPDPGATVTADPGAPVTADPGAPVSTAAGIPGYSLEGGLDVAFDPGNATTYMDALQRITGTSEYAGNRNIMGGLKDLFLPGATRTDSQIQKILLDKGIKATSAAGIEKAKELATRGLLERFAPAALAAMGIGNLVSPGSSPESIDMSGGGINEAISLLEADPDKYDPFGGAKLSPRGAGQFNAYEIQPIYNQPLGTSYQSTARVAGGGGMDVNNYPPRTGAIAGQGTETSDDIPAMLSDGEFVMTAQAVRGAGNGSRSNGMRNMYDMMNNFESRV